MYLVVGLLAGLRSLGYRLRLATRRPCGWIFISDPSPAQTAELTAFYAGNLSLVCVLLWRWRHQPRRWLWFAGGNQWFIRRLSNRVLSGRRHRCCPRWTHVELLNC